MKKIITGVLAMGLALAGFAQETDYYFKGVYDNYCYNGNVATNSAKKVTVNLDNDGDKTYTIKSLGCTRETDIIAIGSFLGSEQVYYSEKEERGLIIEEDGVLYIFGKEGDSENVLIIAVAHTDKKTAKSLDVKTGEEKYSAPLAKLDAKLLEAEAAADRAAMIAATYEIPDGDYSDDFGISGVYYFSEISGEWSEDNYIKGVNIEFDFDNRHMKIHYGPDKTDDAYMRSEMKELVDNEIMETPIMFEGSNMNLIEFLRLKTISLIEEGLFFVHYSSTPYVNSDCDKPKWQPKERDGKENHYVLLGKDTNRIKELMNDPEKVKELALNAQIKECEYWNIYRESSNPMPERGMSDSKLQTEVSEAAINGAASRGWKEEILYAYVQSKEWFTLRNKSTGIIVGRELAAIVVMKTDSGKCKWEQVIFRQNYDGASYGNTYWYGNSQRIYPVDCTEAMKYN